MKVMITGMFSQGVPDYIDVSGFNIRMEEVYVETTRRIVVRPILDLKTPESVIAWETLVNARIEVAEVIRQIDSTCEVVPYVCSIE